jgi:hypothetical protein
MADETKKKLNELWAEAVIDELSVSDIKSNVSNPEFSYDMIFTGVNLGLLYYNVWAFLIQIR